MQNEFKNLSTYWTLEADIKISQYRSITEPLKWRIGLQIMTYCGASQATAEDVAAVDELQNSEEECCWSNWFCRSKSNRSALV